MTVPPAAELIAPPDCNRDEWLRIRREGLGSSDVSALVGLNKYRAPAELWLDKTGQAPLDDEPSEPAEMGILLEPVVRDRFARVHDLTVTRAGTWRSLEWPWMQASPDGFCSDGRGYEGKTCSLWMADDWSEGQTADHAELQAQWGMAVTGLTSWHVAVLIGGQRNEYRVVDRNDELIATLVDVSRRFWHDHVLGDTPPEWDGSAAATAYLCEHNRVSVEDSIEDVDEHEADEILRDKAKTSQAVKDAQADEDAVKNRVRNMLGEKERLMCGQREIATWKNAGKFSEKQLRDRFPYLADAYTRTVTVEQIDVDSLKTDHPDVYRACRARSLLIKT